jgi:two-component system, sensor histidine kinase and response regulator
LATPLILVVDDILENRELARDTLESEGYRVALATDGERAIEVAAHDDPDCILMDIRMPKLDGIAAAERIRKLPAGAGIAIIFLTAQRDVTNFDRALAAGADDFITKPYRPSELVVRVQTAMRLRRLTTEHSELVAEMKTQRDLLMRLELQKEQLIAFLVHDFKNPVHAIDLHAERLLRKPGDAARTTDAATRIKDEARTLLRLITNVLDVSKGDELSLAPTRQTVAARELVDSAVEELSVRAIACGVQLETQITTETLVVDADLMRRVLANLIDNAIRHAPEGSVVRVSVDATEAGVELTVADAGSGIPAAERASVFDKFQRGGAPGGTNRGLGLAFCKLAVEAHGGRISIEDASPGALFRVTLPTS